jgi:hypothetical protein
VLGQRGRGAVGQVGAGGPGHRLQLGGRVGIPADAAVRPGLPAATLPVLGSHSDPGRELPVQIAPVGVDERVEEVEQHRPDAAGRTHPPVPT